MLRTNLATRPFYNVRAVQGLLALLAVLVMSFTAFNVMQIVRLSGQEAALGADAAAAEAEAARLRAEAARTRADIDASELERTAAAVEEANGLIDRRTFSWTALLAQFEATLPRDARIVRIQPREQRGRTFLVTIDLEAYDIADVSRFMEALEGTEAFHTVRPQRFAPDAGVIRASLEAVYLPPPVRLAEGATPPADLTATAADFGGDRRE